MAKKMHPFSHWLYILRFFWRAPMNAYLRLHVLTTFFYILRSPAFLLPGPSGSPYSLPHLFACFIHLFVSTGYYILRHLCRFFLPSSTWLYVPLLLHFLTIALFQDRYLDTFSRSQSRFPRSQSRPFFTCGITFLTHRC